MTLRARGQPDELGDAWLGSGGRGEARPYLDATSATAQVGAPVWASGSGGRGSAGGGGRGMGTRQWRPQFVPLGMMVIEPLIEVSLV